jgi:hypothetical protein
MENRLHPADFMLPLELQDSLEPYGPQFYLESVDPYQPQAFHQRPSEELPSWRNVSQKTRAEVSTRQLTTDFLSLKGRLQIKKKQKKPSTGMPSGDVLKS